MEAIVVKRQKDFAPPPKAEKPRSGGGAFQRDRDGRPQGGMSGGRRDGFARPRQDAPPRPEFRPERVQERHIERTIPARVAEAPESQRSALRAAITAAQPALASSPRSPADMLRERLARKASGGGSAKPEMKRGESPPEQKASPRKPDAREKGREDEISPEALQKVLRGDDDLSAT